MSYQASRACRLIVAVSTCASSHSGSPVVVGQRPTAMLHPRWPSAHHVAPVVRSGVP